MMNRLAKTLVLLHVILSVSAMAWAILVVLQAKDFGWIEPYKEVLEYKPDGTEKSAVRHASEYDKSLAAATEAGRTRDRTYLYVAPALASIRDTERYLPTNHLFYLSELNRLRMAPDNIDAKRLEQGGMVLEPTAHNLGKPVFQAQAVEGIEKSYVQYQADLKILHQKIDAVENEIRTIVNGTKKFAAEMTGTDEENKYVQPGLHQLTDVEFKALTQLKIEIDEIKPHWSKYVEEARVQQIRRDGLVRTLAILKGPAPVAPKDRKKL